MIFRIMISYLLPLACEEPKSSYLSGIRPVMHVYESMMLPQTVGDCRNRNTFSRWQVAIKLHFWLQVLALYSNFPRWSIGMRSYSGELKENRARAGMALVKVG